jgi:hypothetical protein
MLDRLGIDADEIGAYEILRAVGVFGGENLSRSIDIPASLHPYEARVILTGPFMAFVIASSRCQ